MENIRRDLSGFTLIEVILGVSILGVLGLVFVNNFTNSYKGQVDNNLTTNIRRDIASTELLLSENQTCRDLLINSLGSDIINPNITNITRSNVYNLGSSVDSYGDNIFQQPNAFGWSLKIDSGVPNNHINRLNVISSCTSGVDIGKTLMLANIHFELENPGSIPAEIIRNVPVQILIDSSNRILQCGSSVNFDCDDNTFTAVPPSEDSCPIGEIWNDTNKNTIIDSGECEETPVTPLGPVCPENTTWFDQNNDGKVQINLECPPTAFLTPLVLACPGGENFIDLNSNRNVEYPRECCGVNWNQGTCCTSGHPTYNQATCSPSGGNTPQVLPPASPPPNIYDTPSDVIERLESRKVLDKLSISTMNESPSSIYETTAKISHVPSGDFYYNFEGNPFVREYFYVPFRNGRNLISYDKIKNFEIFNFYDGGWNKATRDQKWLNKYNWSSSDLVAFNKKFRDDKSLFLGLSDNGGRFPGNSSNVNNSKIVNSLGLGVTYPNNINVDVSGGRYSFLQPPTGSSAKSVLGFLSAIDQKPIEGNHSPGDFRFSTGTQAKCFLKSHNKNSCIGMYSEMSDTHGPAYFSNYYIDSGIFKSGVYGVIDKYSKKIDGIVDSNINVRACSNYNIINKIGGNSATFYNGSFDRFNNSNLNNLSSYVVPISSKLDNLYNLSLEDSDSADLDILNEDKITSLGNLSNLHKHAKFVFFHDYFESLNSSVNFSFLGNYSIPTTIKNEMRNSFKTKKQHYIFLENRNTSRTNFLFGVKAKSLASYLMSASGVNGSFKISSQYDVITSADRENILIPQLDEAILNNYPFLKRFLIERISSTTNKIAYQYDHSGEAICVINFKGKCRVSFLPPKGNQGGILYSSLGLSGSRGFYVTSDSTKDNLKFTNKGNAYKYYWGFNHHYSLDYCD